ncbi:MAG: PAS domain S-box protein, partial [Syntrophales bacterium]|nr:PAS domain S-box protein [Syntrophales bacterium]
MINLLKPPVFDDEDKTLVAHHLFIIVWTFMAVGWPIVLIAIFIPETIYRWLLIIGVIESAGLILLALNIHGHTRLVSNLLLFIIWVAATGMALTGGGTSSNAMVVYFIIVLIAGLVQSGKAGIITAVLCSLTGLFLVYLEHIGSLPANQVPHTPLTQWIANTIYMAIIISLQYLVSRTIRKSLRQSRQELAERQRVDAALRESEELYTKTIATMPDIMVRLGLDGEILFVNDVGLRLSGYDSAELIGQNMFSFIAPEDQERAAGNTVLMFERRLGPQEYHLIMKDGRKMLFEVNGDVLRNEDGSPYGLVQICRDISERRQAVDALCESEERFRSMIQSLSDMIFILDRNGRLTYESPSVSRIIGYEAGHFIGREPFTHIHADDLDRVMKALGDVFQSANLGIPTEFRHVKADGTWVYLEALGSNQFDNPSIRGIVLTVRDISERKRAEEERSRLEERLSRAEKMEALGTMAGGVAHDLNNVLGVLVGYSELLLMEVPESSPVRRHVKNIMQSGERASAIIQDLLTLARRGVPISEVANLNEIIDQHTGTPEFEKLRAHHPNVRFRFDLADDLLNIKGSPVHLEKTIMNLLSNAAEAIPEAGSVTIRTENRYLDKPIQGYDEMREGDYVVLTVSDSGKGISREDQGKIFEPFYTKKVMGRSGTGLGLAVVWGTVKDHNGYIDVKSEEGKGSTFTLYFPVTREESVVAGDSPSLS